MILIGGCDNHKIENLQAELKQSKEKYEILQSKHQQLQAQCSLLQDDLAALKFDYENLEIKSDQTAEWAQKVAARFGPGLWYIGPEERPLPHKQFENASAPQLTQRLNELFARNHLPRFVLLKVDGDTAYVRINDDQQLTEQMGTTGATSYIQAVTYTLTSLPGIRYVDFAFEEGSHAIPGKYSR